MSNVIREIYTKALLAKGKNETVTTRHITIEKNCTSILGCWIVNHHHFGTIENEQVKVKGNYDVHLWYSYDEICSDIEICHIEYEELIKLEKIDVKKICASDEAISEVIDEPKCIKATIVNPHEILLELEKTMGVNVVGETMIKIEMKESENSINHINPDFIQ